MKDKKYFSNDLKLQRQYSYRKKGGTEGERVSFYSKLTFIQHSEDAEGKLKMTDSKLGAALQSERMTRKTSANCEGRST